MTCRSGVVSVAIVVRTARTTASVLTPEPISLRARTQRSGRVLYACVRTCACGWARDRFLAALSDLGVSLCVRVGRRTS